MNMGKDSYGGILRYTDRIDELLKGNVPTPVSVNIDPVSFCNQRCEYCSSAPYMNISKTDDNTSYEQFEFLIDTLLDTFPGPNKVNTINLVGGGEPTLLRGYEKLIKLAKSKGYLVSMITNGTNLDKLFTLKDEELPNWIGVDFDTVDRETYRNIRKTDDLDKVLKYCLQLTNRIPMTFKYLLTRAGNNNEDMIRDAIRTASEYGFKEFMIRIAYYPDCKLYPLNDIENGNDRLRSLVISECVSVGIKPLLHTEKSTGERHPYDKCKASWVLPVFLANGKVSICCEYRDRKQYYIGDWTEIKSMSEIWSTQTHKDLIESINVKTCPECRYRKYNIEINEFIKKKEESPEYWRWM